MNLTIGIPWRFQSDKVWHIWFVSFFLFSYRSKLSWDYNLGALFYFSYQSADVSLVRTAIEKKYRGFLASLLPNFLQFGKPSFIAILFYSLSEFCVRCLSFWYFSHRLLNFSCQIVIKRAFFKPIESQNYLKIWRIPGPLASSISWTRNFWGKIYKFVYFFPTSRQYLDIFLWWVDSKIISVECVIFFYQFSLTCLKHFTFNLSHVHRS